MKKIFKIMLLASVGLLSSCESDLTAINENPNSPATVDPGTLLTFAENNLFQVEGDNLYASRMIIGTDGEDSNQYYKWNEASFSDYPKTILNLNKMIEMGEASSNKNYVAIGKFLRSYAFYNLTLKFGDIPYSEAVQGEKGISQPKYDSQEAVFAGILTELKDANDMIGSGQVNGDLIYNGDATKWKKLINSFRLKVLITLSKKSKVGNYNISSEFASIAGSQPLMADIKDNGELKFADVANSRYTMFNNSGYGSSLYMADYFVNLFKERKDPRLFTFAEQTTGAKEKGLAITDYNGYNGGNPVSSYSDNAALVTAKNISKVNTRFYKDATNEPSNILSYPELQFILAEAAARGWIAGSPKTYYDKGITSSFDFYKSYVKNASTLFAGFDVNSYLGSTPVNFANASTLDQKLNLILTQKYMTMFHQSQWTSYYDYLRTGYPAWPLQPGVTAPYRFRYPQSEYSYNKANLQSALNAQFSGKDDIRSMPWWLK